MEHRYLPARNRRIAHAVLDGCALAGVAAEYGLTPARIAQITAQFAATFGFNEPYTQSVFVLRERYQEKLKIQVGKRQQSA